MSTIKGLLALPGLVSSAVALLVIVVILVAFCLALAADWWRLGQEWLARRRMDRLAGRYRVRRGEVAKTHRRMTRR
jgi:UPF0716 family protein affecting phage T7 exclusion